MDHLHVFSKTQVRTDHLTCLKIDDYDAIDVKETSALVKVSLRDP